LAHKQGLGADANQVAHSLKRGRKNSFRFDLLYADLPAGVDWANFRGNADGAFLEAGKKLELLLLEGDQNNRAFREARDAIRNVLSRLTVRVEYEDFYGKLMAPEERTLSWFARHDQSPHKRFPASPVDFS
jgi:hypothetical protein